MAPIRCQRCESPLEILRHPLRRLRGTGHWWHGVRSLFTGPLWMCPRCGAAYTGDGTLLAAGAVETDSEARLRIYRRDMAQLRDSFAGVIVAAGLAVTWLVAGSGGYELYQLLATAGVGGAAVVPFSYFARKARLAKKDLKRLRAARREGSILQPPSP